MNSSSPRVALAGCGGIARAHLQAIGAPCLVALCDQNVDAATRLRTESGCDAPTFATLKDALESQKPDVVVICTPPTTHFELVRLALESGANVLCEKPLATTARDALGLVDLAYCHEKTLRTAAKYRFHEGVVNAKSLLDSGEAGALESVRIAFGAPFDFKKLWHSNTSLSGGGVWMDNGPHALDLARFFAGELRLNSVAQWKCDADLETEARVCLRSQGGANIEIALSWHRALGDDFAVVQCERGTVRIGWRQTSWCEHGKTARILAGAYDKSACFAAVWNAFLNGDARLGTEDGARVVELLEAVYDAARR